MGQSSVDIVLLPSDIGCDSCPRVGVLEPCNDLVTEQKCCDGVAMGRVVLSRVVGTKCTNASQQKHQGL